MKTRKHFLPTLLIVGMIVGIQGCYHDDDVDNDTGTDVPTTYKYKVTVTNISSGQPLTPVAAIIHKSGYSSWQFGMSVSNGLEKLAESGDTTDFISEAQANTNVLNTSISEGGPFGPGASVSMEMTVSTDDDLKLSLASMLANTNDAFISLNAKSLSDLEKGKMTTYFTKVYDAGTEGNSESLGTIPGPADSSTAADKGYNAARDDANFVAIHPGVLTKDDGLSSSILDEMHRWNGPAARIDIEKM